MVAFSGCVARRCSREIQLVAWMSTSVADDGNTISTALSALQRCLRCSVAVLSQVFTADPGGVADS